MGFTIIEFLNMRHSGTKLPNDCSLLELNRPSDMIRYSHSAGCWVPSDFVVIDALLHQHHLCAAFAFTITCGLSKSLSTFVSIRYIVSSVFTMKSIFHPRINLAFQCICKVELGVVASGFLTILSPFFSYNFIILLNTLRSSRMVSTQYLASSGVTAAPGYWYCTLYGVRLLSRLGLAQV
jgi:hypothetical protein